MIAQIYSIIMV